METNHPEDVNVKLARAMEQLKSYNSLKKEVTELTKELEQAVKERNQLHEDLELAKLRTEFLQTAAKNSELLAKRRKRHTFTVALFSDLFFAISNVLTCWGINYLSSTPRNDTGMVLLGAGILIFTINTISSKKLASGGDIE